MAGSWHRRSWRQLAEADTSKRRIEQWRQQQRCNGRSQQRGGGQRGAVGQGGCSKGAVRKGCSQCSKGVGRSKGCSLCSKGSLSTTQPHSLAGLGVVSAGEHCTGASIAGGKEMIQLYHCCWEGRNDPAVVDCWLGCSNCSCLALACHCPLSRKFELSDWQVCMRMDGKVAVSGSAEVVVAGEVRGVGAGGGSDISAGGGTSSASCRLQKAATEPAQPIIITVCVGRGQGGGSGGGVG